MATLSLFGRHLHQRQRHATSGVDIRQRQGDDLRGQLPRPLLQGLLHVLQLCRAAAGDPLAQRGRVIRERLLQGTTARERRPPFTESVRVARSYSRLTQGPQRRCCNTKRTCTENFRLRPLAALRNWISGAAASST